MTAAYREFSRYVTSTLLVEFILQKFVKIITISTRFCCDFRCGARPRGWKGSSISRINNTHFSCVRIPNDLYHLTTTFIMCFVGSGWWAFGIVAAFYIRALHQLNVDRGKKVVSSFQRYEQEFNMVLATGLRLEVHSPRAANKPYIWVCLDFANEDRFLFGYCEVSSKDYIAAPFVCVRDG